MKKVLQTWSLDEAAHCDSAAPLGSRLSAKAQHVQIFRHRIAEVSQCFSSHDIACNS